MIRAVTFNHPVGSILPPPAVPEQVLLYTASDARFTSDSPCEAGRQARVMAMDGDLESVFLAPAEWFDLAIVGISELMAAEPVRVVYDSKIAQRAMLAQGLSQAQVLGVLRAAAAAENGPCFIDVYSDPLHALEVVCDVHEDVTRLEPGAEFDRAIMGITDPAINAPARFVYDSEGCVQALAADNGGDFEAASEFYQTNTLGAAFDGWPLFVTRLPDLFRMDSDPTLAHGATTSFAES